MTAALFIAAALACTSPSDTVEIRMDGKVAHYTIIYQMTGDCGAMIEIAPETDSPMLLDKPKPVKANVKKKRRLPCKRGRHRNAQGICGRWR